MARCAHAGPRVSSARPRVVRARPGRGAGASECIPALARRKGSSVQSSSIQQSPILPSSARSSDAQVCLAQLRSVWTLDLRGIGISGKRREVLLRPDCVCRSGQLIMQRVGRAFGRVPPFAVEVGRRALRAGRGQEGGGEKEKTATEVGYFFLSYEDLCVTSRQKAPNIGYRHELFSPSECRRGTDWSRARGQFWRSAAFCRRGVETLGEFRPAPSRRHSVCN